MLFLCPASGVNQIASHLTTFISRCASSVSLVHEQRGHLGDFPERHMLLSKSDEPSLRQCCSCASAKSELSVSKCHPLQSWICSVAWEHLWKFSEAAVCHLGSSCRQPSGISQRQVERWRNFAFCLVRETVQPHFPVQLSMECEDACVLRLYYHQTPVTQWSVGVFYALCALGTKLKGRAIPQTPCNINCEEKY